jgi:hypothetical protein
MLRTKFRILSIFTTGRFQMSFHKRIHTSDLMSAVVILMRPLYRTSNGHHVVNYCVSQRGRSFQARETLAAIAVANATTVRPSGPVKAPTCRVTSD